MAIIALENIQLYGKHGCYESEALIGGHYELDIYVRASISRAAETDELEDTIDYEGVYNYCVDVFAERHNLLESLAFKMAEGLVQNFEDAIGVCVKISKIHPPLPGEVGKSYVEYTTSNY